MWVPFYYEDGYYGVPETTTMEMMYYRADIFQRLGIKVPNTWDDLYKILPILQQNGMNFPPVGDGIFLQMHGAQYYTQDGTKAGFGTPAGYDAFKQWTDLQNKYGLDQNSASFYQHFRDGSYPIGIADLNTYIQLKVAAPELNGLWGMAPIPGVEQNGQVVRWTSGSLQSSMIFKQTKMPQQSWEYLKWWTSEAAQEEYGAELETLNGITFRWNTANIGAFVKLPWTHDDLQAILEQWRWFRAIPNVPGNYYLQRNLVNAWTRTVVDGQSYRTSLDTLIQNMNAEIGRKEQEFNIVDKSGNLIRSLNLPVITKPWDGVDQYVAN
jgi:ABC-type glycerol-3-phosphate transport system substrate-binding protein